jgi:hypothetical protein
MTARRDGCFEEAIALLKSARVSGYDEKKLRAAIAVLRAAEKAVIHSPDEYCENEYLYHDEKGNVRLARAILNARRVHDRGKEKT